MASLLRLHHPYSALSLVLPSGHPHTSFSIIQKPYCKNYKISCVRDNTLVIKHASNANTNESSASTVKTTVKNDSSATGNGDVTSPKSNNGSNTGEAVVTDCTTMGATSRNNGQYFFCPPDKSTIKATVSAKFDENQLDDSLPHTSIKAKLMLEIVPAELDPRTGLEEETVKGEANGTRYEDEVKFEATFEVPLDFGEIGAVIVRNEHDKEMYLYNITLGHLRKGILTITCNSWVHSKDDNPVDRIFFTNKSYLPSQTPSGVKQLREKELMILRGDGTGERKKFDRIYDYDVYNDLGNPDKGSDLLRPVLGGTQYAYPRRCRTGRPHCEKDPLSESRPKPSEDIYVPRDEEFSELKSQSYTSDKLSEVLPALIAFFTSAESDREFQYFTKIDTLFTEGMNVREFPLPESLPSWIQRIDRDGEKLLSLHFEIPELIARDKFSWLRDEEFCRQTLAGLNPCSIELVKEWPLRSKLDPKEYGPPESAITKEMVEEHIKGFMTFDKEWPLRSKLDPEEYGPPESTITKEMVEEHIKGFMTFDKALEQEKLFMLDYHDILLPYVNKVREINGTTLYGSRTLMFLKPTEELMPVAIELTRPPANKQPQWKEVFMPSSDATGAWLWKLAKAHVLAHDSGIHQLVSHWLRTHCVTEPYIIASNRQLSAMHPIYRLLHPHFRYTMEINAEARKSLINANGIIEMGFSPGKYSMELSSIAYDQWRFDLQALPADLINRGMASKDPNSPHGLKLAIEDYPFANDGLILWDAIKEWVTSYVDYYYSDASFIESDYELKAWWDEIRTVGHADKQDEPWWPILNTPNDLIEILTTMIWVVSGHHAAVNFGQYDFAGYFPNRPAIARTKMPTEDSTKEEWERFVNQPEQALLACLPSVFQATIVIAIFHVLSSHSKDEEYIGQCIEPSWEEHQNLKSAFEIFKARMMELKATIDQRNNDTNLKNRHGVGLLPYELLVPVSEEGVTGKGVPNSVSI